MQNENPTCQYCPKAAVGYEREHGTALNIQVCHGCAHRNTTVYLYHGGTSIKPSYHKQEMQRDLTRQRRNEKAPLADRKAAAADWLQRLTEYPETLTRCVEFILNGSCGHAPQYEAQKIIVKSSRKTATALLGQMVASVEDQCCAAGARRSFRKLTKEQQETANGFILQAVNDWADAGGTWTRQG